MIKTIFTFVLSLIAFSGFSQRNAITFTTQNFLGFSDKFKNESPLFNIKSSGLLIDPTIGYMRNVKGNTWVGGDIGFFKQGTKANGFQQVAATTNGIEEALSFNSYYLSISISEIFTHDKYKFILGFQVPFQLNTSVYRLYSINEMDIHTKEVYFFQKTETFYPNEASLGLYAHGGVQRKIFRSLYFGADLNMGITTLYSKGNNRVLTKIYSAGITQVYDDNTQINSLVSRMRVSPTMSLLYYF